MSLPQLNSSWSTLRKQIYPSFLKVYQTFWFMEETLQLQEGKLVFS
jgi:hypothetical protein